MLTPEDAEDQRDREGLRSAAQAEGEDPGVIAAGDRRQQLGVAQPWLTELRAEMLEQPPGGLGHSGVSFAGHGAAILPVPTASRVRARWPERGCRRLPCRDQFRKIKPIFGDLVPNESTRAVGLALVISERRRPIITFLCWHSCCSVARRCPLTRHGSVVNTIGRRHPPHVPVCSSSCLVTPWTITNISGGPSPAITGWRSSSIAVRPNGGRRQVIGRRNVVGPIAAHDLSSTTDCDGRAGPSCVSSSRGSYDDDVIPRKSVHPRTVSWMYVYLS